jgi:hypothetical protein
MRAVHPDRFVASPERPARELNEASLASLNAYVDALSRGDSRRCRAQALRFLVRQGTSALQELRVSLPAGGSLQPLFTAFASLQQHLQASPRGGTSPRLRSPELQDWLRSSAPAAAATQQADATRRSALSAAVSSLEREFGLASFHLGFLAEGGSASAEHVGALAQALRCLSPESAAALRRLRLVLADEQEMPRGAGRGEGWLAEDGCVWLPLGRDWRSLWRFLCSLDLARATADGAASAADAAALQARLPQLARLLRLRELFSAPALPPAQLECFAAALEAQSAAITAMGCPSEPFGFAVQVVSELAESSSELSLRAPDGRLLACWCAAQQSLLVAAACPPLSLARFLQSHGARCKAALRECQDGRAAMEAMQQQLAAALGLRLAAASQLAMAHALSASRRLLSAAEGLRGELGAACAGLHVLLVEDASPLRYTLLSTGVLAVPASFRLADLTRALRDLVRQ